MADTVAMDLAEGQDYAVGGVGPAERTERIGAAEAITAARAEEGEDDKGGDGSERPGKIEAPPIEAEACRPERVFEFGLHFMQQGGIAGLRAGQDHGQDRTQVVRGLRTEQTGRQQECGRRQDEPATVRERTRVCTVGQ